MVDFFVGFAVGVAFYPLWVRAYNGIKGTKFVQAIIAKFKKDAA